MAGKANAAIEVSPGTTFQKHGSPTSLLLAILMPEEQFCNLYGTCSGKTLGKTTQSYIENRRQFEAALNWPNLSWNQRFRAFFA